MKIPCVRIETGWDSSWGKLLLNPEIRDSTSWHARLFRRRFHPPYDLFVTFVEECRGERFYRTG